jgi:hypothetical protein
MLGIPIAHPLVHLNHFVEKRSYDCLALYGSIDWPTRSYNIASFTVHQVITSVGAWSSEDIFIRGTIIVAYPRPVVLIILV